MELAPRSKEWEARVRDSFARQAFMATLGVRLDQVRPGHVELVVDHRDALTQQQGFGRDAVVAPETTR